MRHLFVGVAAVCAGAFALLRHYDNERSKLLAESQAARQVLMGELLYWTEMVDVARESQEGDPPQSPSQQPPKRATASVFTAQRSPRP